MTAKTRAKGGGWRYHASISADVNRFTGQIAALSPSAAKELDLGTLGYPMASLVADIHAEVRRAVAVRAPGQEDYGEMAEEMETILAGPCSFFTDTDDLQATFLHVLYDWGDWFDVEFDSDKSSDMTGGRGTA